GAPGRTRTSPVRLALGTRSTCSDGRGPCSTREGCALPPVARRSARSTASCGTSAIRATRGPRPISRAPRSASSCWRAAGGGENRKPMAGRKQFKVAVSKANPPYAFPRIDCALLPIPNTTVEMLAQYLAGRVCRELTTAPGVDLMAIEVEVEENFGQSATYREALG